MCSCVRLYVWEKLLWSLFLAVILHDVWGMPNIQAGVKAEQNQWGENNDLNLSPRARCLQSKSHLIKSVLLVLAYQAHLLYSSVCVCVCQCAWLRVWVCVQQVWVCVCVLNPCGFSMLKKDFGVCFDIFVCEGIHLRQTSKYSLHVWTFSTRLDKTICLCACKGFAASLIVSLIRGPEKESVQ